MSRRYQDRLDDIVTLRTASQTALLGAVSASLCGVTVGINDKHEIRLHAYFDGPWTEDEAEDIEVVSAEIAAAFSDSTVPEVRMFDRRQIQGQIEGLDIWAFSRKGFRA